MKSLFFILISSPLIMLSQNIESKVKEGLGIEKYSYFFSNYPDSIEFYKFIIENGYRIFHKEYIKGCETIAAQKIIFPDDWINNGNINFQKFNILKLNVQFKPDIKTYYKIENTDYFLELMSFNYLKKKFENKK